MGFYIALIMPLPFLAGVVNAPVPASWLAIGAILGGGLALYGVLSERVILDDRCI
ncbi:MAG: hypothetical protein MJA27_11430 [Pseudanabaenales cyanobacterium]|nr:hypothetical protein [Pseudanabaenales cyanobacterium]